MFSSIPMTLGSVGQEVFTRRHMNGSVKREGKTLGFPVPVNQPAKEGVTLLTGVMDLICQKKKKKGGLLLYTVGGGGGKAVQECIYWA